MALKLLTLLAFALVLVALVVAKDAALFYEILSDKHKSPWYSTSWLKQPYTNAMLANTPRREYWTRNHVGSERWLVREQFVGDTVFWTALERVPVK